MLRFAITDRRLYEVAASPVDNETTDKAGCPIHRGPNAMSGNPQSPNALPWLDRLCRRSAELSAHGVDFLLVREKDLPAAELVMLCRKVREAARSTGKARILVSGRADIALAAGLDGVHLASGAGELTPSDVRRVFAGTHAAPPFVSVSCHTLEDVLGARANGAHAAVFGPVFGKSVGGVAVVPPVGLEALRLACKAAKPMPVFALGGISAQDTEACREAGARGIAGIRLFY